MAKRTVTDCDKCGFKGVPTQAVSVTVDLFTDAAGSSDTEQRSFDLCGKCLKYELNLFLSRLTIPEARVWVKKITGQPFRDRDGRITP